MTQFGEIILPILNYTFFVHCSASSEYPIVTAPEEMKGLTLLDALNTEVNWTSNLVENLQYELRWAPQRGLCISYANADIGESVVSYPNATIYEPVFTCE